MFCSADLNDWRLALTGAFGEMTRAGLFRSDLRFLAAACSARERSREVGFGNAVSMAGRLLDQLDPVALRVGDPRGPRPVGAGGQCGRLSCNPLGGEMGQQLIQRLDLDDEVVDAGAEVDAPFAGS